MPTTVELQVGSTVLLVALADLDFWSVESFWKNGEDGHSMTWVERKTIEDEALATECLRRNREAGERFVPRFEHAVEELACIASTHGSSCRRF